MEYQTLTHGFGPFIPPKAKYLFLGTFPSVKSREQQFYYGHPQNNFWRLLADVFSDGIPKTLEEKKQFLTRHQVAVYDVIEQCDIIGSSDASIKNIIPTDLKSIVRTHGIEKIFVNGRKAEQVFKEYHPNLTANYLPSSSPANAAMKYEKKLSLWRNAILGVEDSV